MNNNQHYIQNPQDGYRWNFGEVPPFPPPFLAPTPNLFAYGMDFYPPPPPPQVFQHNNGYSNDLTTCLPKLTPPLEPSSRLHQWMSPNPPNFLENRSRCRTISMSSSTTSTGKDLLKKTKICEHWRRSGQCSYGESCWYAHGEFDLRKNVYGVASKIDLRKKDDTSEKKKRISTNVKGLTVNIPNTNLDSSGSGSMPLSPAQERWISMSLGTNSSEKTTATTSSTSSISTQQDTLTSTSTVILESSTAGEEPKSPGFHSQNQNQHGAYNSMFSRAGNSFGRGPNHRQSIINHFNGMPQNQVKFAPRIPTAHNFRYPPPPPPTATQIPSLNGSVSNQPGNPSAQPLYGSIVDEIYRRQQQKHSMENQYEQRKNEAIFRQMYSNMIQQQELGLGLQQQQQQQAAQQQQRREFLMQNDRLGRSSAVYPPNYHPEQFHHQQQQFQIPTHQTYGRIPHPDCSCAHSRPKQQQQPHLPNFSTFANLFPQPPPPPTTSPNSISSRPETPISSIIPPPPKMYQSLLPNEQCFEIWLDRKGERENEESLLSKMELLRGGDLGFDRGNSDYQRGNLEELEDLDQEDHEEINLESEPVLSSLYDLLSSENLLEKEPERGDFMHQQSPNNQLPNIFDFDLLNITVNSEITTSSEQSPSLYLLSNDNTPRIEQQHNLGEKNITPKNSSDEICFFYSSSGNCPFGDSCSLSHLKS